MYMQVRLLASQKRVGKGLRRKRESCRACAPIEPWLFRYTTKIRTRRVHPLPFGSRTNHKTDAPLALQVDRRPGSVQERRYDNALTTMRSACVLSTTFTLEPYGSAASLASCARARVARQALENRPPLAESPNPIRLP